MLKLLEEFKDKFLFDLTLDGDDLNLIFEGNEQSIKLSHLFTIPFGITKSGLKRIPEWHKPVEFWKKEFLKKKITDIKFQADDQLYLEFDYEMVLISNRNIISINSSDKALLWSSFERNIL